MKTIKDIKRKALEDFILDARAFIAYGTAEGMTNDVILSNLAHDIFGLAKGDDLMLPRVNGYQKSHPFEANGALGDGSGYGCFLPILNAQRRKQNNEPKRQTTH